MATPIRPITPVKAARGLGSAKSGTGHHVRQRVSALALLGLVPWFLVSLMFATRAGYDGALAWAGQPWNALLLLLLSGAAFYHMRLGMQVIIEDYIGKGGMRGALLILNTFAAAALFAASVLAVLKIWLS